MSTPNLVASFYERIWNAGDYSAVEELLAEDFAFRGSSGSEMRGRNAFADYARSVRGSLSNFLCQILTFKIEWMETVIPVKWMAGSRRMVFPDI